MDTIMDVNAEVLEKIFNQEEVPVIVIVLKGLKSTLMSKVTTNTKI